MFQSVFYPVLRRIFLSFEFEKIDLRVELPHTHPHTPHTPITRTHDTHTGVTSPILVRHNTYLQNSASIRLGCFDTSSAHRIAEILLRNSALDLQDTIAEAQFHASLRLNWTANLLFRLFGMIPIFFLLKKKYSNFFSSIEISKPFFSVMRPKIEILVW